MATQATDMSSSEEEIDYTYYSSTECESDFKYEGKAGYTCEPEYSKEELGKLGKELREEEADDIVSDDGGDTLNPSRLENLHWCTCYHLLYHANFARVEML